MAVRRISDLQILKRKHTEKYMIAVAIVAQWQRFNSQQVLLLCFPLHDDYNCNDYKYLWFHYHFDYS